MLASLFSCYTMCPQLRSSSVVFDVTDSQSTKHHIFKTHIAPMTKLTVIKKGGLSQGCVVTARHII